MKTIEKCFKVLDKISFILSALCVGGMLICVFLQVVARFFQFSINWTTEMSQYFFLWSTTFASYVAARRGKLIGVELVQKKFPWPVQRVLRFAAYGAAAWFYILVDHYCAIQLPKLMVQTTPVLKWSMGCGIGACLGCNVKIMQPDGGWHYARVCKDGPVFDAKEVCLRG